TNVSGREGNFSAAAAGGMIAAKYSKMNEMDLARTLRFMNVSFIDGLFLQNAMNCMQVPRHSLLNWSKPLCPAVEARHKPSSHVLLKDNICLVNSKILG